MGSLQRFVPAVLVAASVPVVAAPASSSLTVPVSVSLASLQEAVNANVPTLLAPLVLEPGGSAGDVGLHGEVVRSGHVRVRADGPDALLMVVPVRITATVSVGASGTFSGEAEVHVRVKPKLNPDWSLSVQAAGTHRWTKPLAFEVLPGVRVPLTALADPVIEGQLRDLTGVLQEAVRSRVRVRERAEAAWRAVQQPWRVPSVPPVTVGITPVDVTSTPLAVTPTALTLTLDASFTAQATLAGSAVASGSRAPPPLRLADRVGSGVRLSVPVTLPYADLSRAMTDAAARREYPLAGPFKPVVRVRRVTVSPAASGRELLATLDVVVTAVGVRVNTTVDVTGRPALDATGRALHLQDVRVRTRPTGVTARVVGWLADRHVQSFLAGNARYDTTRDALRLQRELQARLPWSPAPNVTVAGRVERVRLTGVSVRPEGIVLIGQVGGALEARLSVP